MFGNKKAVSTIMASLLMVVIVVVASTMVFSYSTGLIGGLLVKPQTSTESLVLENFYFASATNVTLYMRNTGGSAATLGTYYVKDASNNQYRRTAWLGPVANPNGLLTAFVTIGSTCASSCTLTGTAFTFVPGLYSITVVTSRNNQFTFTVSL